ncbi:MAG TPA: protein tyrosine phosphatase family protein [Verrucomicrobiae bacterium]|nr:protein tyrosine phosphatase family protein [Verrucomicrobiae bacterium]
MENLKHIENYLEISDQLATGGMPRPEDFPLIRQAGFEVVINLALPTSDGAIANEGELVTSQEMTYVHIPVKFDAPKDQDFEQFTRFLESCGGQKVFVHCVVNCRVAAFVFLHRLRMGTDRSIAEKSLRQIWEPNEVWRNFINQQLAKIGQAKLDVPASA